MNQHVKYPGQMPFFVVILRTQKYTYSGNTLYTCAKVVGNLVYTNSEKPAGVVTTRQDAEGL